MRFNNKPLTLTPQEKHHLWLILVVEIENQEERKPRFKYIQEQIDKAKSILEKLTGTPPPGSPALVNGAAPGESRRARNRQWIAQP